MVQVAMLVTGVVAGVRGSTARSRAIAILVVFTVVLAVQTVVVGTAGDVSTGRDAAIYSVVQVVSLGIAFALSAFVHSSRTRRFTAARRSAPGGF